MWKNIVITVGILAAASGFCELLLQFTTVDTHVPLLFVLAVLFISRYTDGYLYGIAASFAAVIGVNYMFTYPYMEFNFTITGYPLTFLSMLAVSMCVSTLTTQIKHQEQLRLEAEKEKMRGNLLRAVSHDIRTPLTTIMASVSGIIDNYTQLDDRKKISLLQDIHDDAQWLIRVVENILSITRIHSDHTQINTQEEVVEEIISSAVLKFQKRFPEMDVKIEMPKEFLMIPMDGILIEQVLMNLMENSVLHGKTTSQIYIKIAQEDHRVRISVEDDGAGIRKEIIPHIFDENRIVTNDEKSDSKRNMGIGLSVCMSIIKAHLGDMEAKNTDRGACFTFWLPLEKGDMTNEY